MNTIQPIELFNNQIAVNYSPITFKYVNGNKMKVNDENILDQYFTKEDIAISLFRKSLDVISQFEDNIEVFYWVEPSAGNGVFFNLLPKEK